MALTPFLAAPVIGLPVRNTRVCILLQTCTHTLSLPLRVSYYPVYPIGSSQLVDKESTGWMAEFATPRNTLRISVISKGFCKFLEFNRETYPSIW